MIDPTKFERAWLLASNMAMLMSWAKVLKLFLHNWRALAAPLAGPTATNICLTRLTPALQMAVGMSGLEFFNAMVGYTRSKPQYVLLFCVIRAAVELLVAPLLTPTCTNRWHLFTAFCWSLGDTIRFFCFVMDVMVPGGSNVFKHVRYTVGPLVFPLGAAGEMIMVATLGYQRNWPVLYVVAALWVAGFYPLFMSLLANRRKFLDRLSDKIRIE